MTFCNDFHKKTISRVALLCAAIIAVIAFAFLCEFITNDASDIRSEDRKLISVGELNAQFDGIITGDNGVMTSEKTNARIMIKNVQGNTLHIQLADKTFYQPVVTVGGEQVDTAMSGPPPMHYSDFFSYDIHGKDGEINITIQDEGIGIKNVEIDNRYHFNQYKFVYMILLGFCVLFFCIVLLCKYRNVEVVFLVCSLTLTLMMSVMLPLSTTNTYDEEIHYSRQASFSDDSIAKYDMDLGNRQVPGLFDIDYRGEMNEELRNEVIADGDQFNVDVTKHKTIVFAYNRLAYAPSVIIIWLAKQIGFSFPIVLIIGRAINGVLYSLLLFFAIKRLKSQKVLLSVIGLTPLYIFQASTYTYDWWVAAFLMLGCAYLISEVQQPGKKVDRKSYIVMILSFVIGCGAKAIYCPIVFAMLMMRQSKFKTKKYYWLNIGCIVIVFLAVTSTFMLGFLVQGPGTGDARGGSEVNATEQIAFILGEPVKYTVILIKFLAGYVSPTALAGNLSLCGYLGVGAGGVLLMIIIVVAAITDRNEADEHSLNTRNRIISWGVCFIIICLISSVLYIEFTPVRAGTIEGVQGRYLMPLLFAIFTFIGSKNIANRIRPEIYMVGMIGTTTLTTLLVFGQLVVRHYY